MDKRPKIAFCFSWQARTLDQTYLFFQKNLFDAAKEQWFDYDVYCAVEDDEDADKVNLLNPTKVEKIKSNEVEKIIEEIYWESRKEKIFKKYAFWDFIPNKKENTAYKFMQQIYKVSRSIMLAKEQNIKYDIIMRTRFDFVLFNKINFSGIRNDAKNKTILCNKWTYFIPKFMLNNLLKINDMFFFWDEESMFILWEMFYKVNLCFKWWKPIWFIFHIFSCVKSFIIYFNDKINRRILPLVPILYIESFFYRVFSCENCYYFYFINNWIKVVLDDFSRIVLRKNTAQSAINLVDKNRFEV